MKNNINTQELTDNNQILFGTIKSRIRLLTISFVTILLIYSIIIFIQSYKTNDDLKKSRTISLNLKSVTEKLLVAINQSAASHRAYFLTILPEYKESNLLLWKNVIFPYTDTLLIVANKSRRQDLIKVSKEITELSKNYSKTQERLNFHINNNINNYLKLTDTSFVDRQEKLLASKNYLRYGTNLIKTELEPLRKTISNKVLELLQKQNNIIQKTLDNTQANLVSSIYITITVSLLIITLTITLGYYITSHLRKSVGKTVSLLTQLSHGELPKKASLNYDEFDEIINSINALSSNMRNASEFALQVGRSNFYTIFKSSTDNDILGNSLLKMRDQLREVAAEEDKRNWVTEGISKISDIIRNNSISLEILSDTFLLSLVEYVGAVQGGIFLTKINEQDTENVHLYLISHYAYNQKKYTQKNITIYGQYADTLIGQAYLEGEKILLKEIPDNYLVINSGLGEEKPSNLLLMPIKINKEIEGILEISFFSEIDNYKINFVERICQVLASSLVSVRSSIITKQLLTGFQQQTKQLKNQEDIMRQSMKELASTQEEMQSKQKELENLKQNLEIEVQQRTIALKNSLLRFDLINQASTEGLWDMVVPEDNKISYETSFYWTPKLLESLGYDEIEFPNKLSSWVLRVHPEDVEQVFKEFINHFEDESGQTTFSNIHRIKNNQGEYRWFEAGSKVLRDENGKGLRIAGFLNDVTYQKELDQAMIDLKNQQEEMTKKQTELEITNKKMNSNEEVLKKILQKMQQSQTITKQQKEELQKQTEEMKAQEEELRQNMEELTTTQEEMVKKQNELEVANEKMKNNEEIMKKTFEKMQQSQTITKQQKEELQKQTEEMKAQEEELRQNMEELTTTQEEMVKKQNELQNTNKRMKANEEILKKTFEKMKANEMVMKQQQQNLKEQTEEMKAQEEEMRQNMDALIIIQDQMEKKQLELEIANKKMKQNEEEIQNNMEMMMATQEKMAKKQREYQADHQKIKQYEEKYQQQLVVINKKNELIEQLQKKLNAKK